MRVKRSTPVTEVKDIFGAQTKVLDREDGIVEAIVSVTGIKDEVDDVIEAGAYAKTLAVRKPKGIRSHDWDRPAMKTLAIDELLPGDAQLPAKTNRGEPWPREAGAVKVLMQWNLDTKDGSEGFSNVKFYDSEQEWSIGYNVPRGGARMVKNVRHIIGIDLFEYSDVLFGAMPLAGTQDIKSHGGLIVSGGLWTPDGVDAKSLPGSYEERRDALDHALDAAFRAEYADASEGDMGIGYQMIRGTFGDRVISCFHHRSDNQDWEYQYTFADGEVILGERRPVKVEEVLLSDPDPVEDTAPEVAVKPLTADELREGDSLRAYV